MKVIKTIEVQDLSELSLRVAHATLTRLMSDVALPEAMSKAPGVNLPQRIRTSPVKMVGNGKFRVALIFPGKYRPVEEGSGIYAGGQPQQIKPKKAGVRALALPYGYFASAMWYGQEAQPFALPAIEHIAEIFPGEFANDLNAALSRGNRRGSTNRRRS
jgi:hypothetical protein